jgi:hypothetical protein
VYVVSCLVSEVSCENWRATETSGACSMSHFVAITGPRSITIGSVEAPICTFAGCDTAVSL